MISTRAQSREPTAAMAASGDAALIRKLTCFDTLTGLPNRVLFREQLGLTLRMARRNATPAAVLLADIDDFRRIKISLGQTQADAFLKVIAARLSACLRDSDVLAGGAQSHRASAVARLNGNEFAIVLSGLREPHHAWHVAQRMREIVASGVIIGGSEVFPTLSIGAALFPVDGEDADGLIANRRASS